MYNKNEVAARETRLREAIRRFVRSDQRVVDFEALLLAGATAFRQGIALDYETVHRIIGEVLDEEVVEEPPPPPSRDGNFVYTIHKGA